jgi:hypothetical protein
MQRRGEKTSMKLELKLVLLEVDEEPNRLCLALDTS